MRYLFSLYLFVLIAGCSNAPNPSRHELSPTVEKPKVSFSFDDGITSDILDYPFKEWNGKILSALKAEDIQALFFVTGSNKLDEKGQYLLQSWNDAGHQIGNHTWSHPNFNGEDNTIAVFERELLRTDSVISKFPNFVKLFRFPYLKEGNTEEKIAGIRQVMATHDYHNGHVTIDASDWYVNQRLIRKIREMGEEAVDLAAFRKFYITHILERAQFYEALSMEINQRHIPHVLLLHHNLTSALFLGDLIQAFKTAGWEIVDAPSAYKDEVYSRQPMRVPAGESLIWSLAKASGNYEDLLRYPAEDSRYEKPAMDSLGL